MKKAQGLLETIVAIGVITTGLVSVISLVISNLTTQREAAMRYQAVNLAREGIELARNARDSNWINSNNISPWDGLIENREMTIIFNPASANELSFASVIGNNAEIQQCENGFYAQGSACSDTTPFKRVLTILPRACDDIFQPPLDATCEDIELSDRNDIIALEIISTVVWQDKGRERKVELNETLYDWR